MSDGHAGAASFGGHPALGPVDVAGPVLTAHACRDNPRPKSPHAPTLAYDRFQLPVLTAHLQSGDLTIVLAALTSLRRLTTTHDVVVKVVECGLHMVLAATIVAHLHTENVILSRLALQCLLTIGKSPAMRADVACEPSVADALRQSIGASDALCRSLAYDTLATAASAHTTASGLMAAGFIADAIDRVATELDAAGDDTGINLLCLALYLLRQLTRHGAGSPACVTTALAGGAVPTLLHVCTAALAALPAVTTPETAHGWNTALHHASMVLMALTFPREGKAALLAVEGSVGILAAVCGAATTMEVATAAVGALMSVCLDDAAKPPAAASGVADVLVTLVTGNAAAPEAGTLLSYACRTLAALHSHPAVGTALSGHTELHATLRALVAAGTDVGVVGSTAAAGTRGALVRAARDLLALLDRGRE